MSVHRRSREHCVLALLHALRGSKDAPGDGANLHAYCATFHDGGRVYFLSSRAPDMNGLRVGEDGAVLPRVFVVRWPLFVAIRLDSVMSVREIALPADAEASEY